MKASTVRRLRTSLLVGWLCLAWVPCAAAVVVRFDQPVYVVTGPGQTFVAHLLIDGVAATPEPEPVRRGLFSFAAEVDFPAAKAQVASGDLAVVSQLSYFGFDPGPYAEVGPGRAAAKGNVDQYEVGPAPYLGTLLASFTVENLAVAVDSYLLEIDFFNTLGKAENHFVDGAGVTLDGQITFVPSRVLVVPEPATCGLLACALGSGALRRRRRAPDVRERRR